MKKRTSYYRELSADFSRPGLIAPDVTVVPAAGLSRIHAACGHENRADSQSQQR
jgi:hypothetical protein